ncbi:FHA domain-containing protein [Nonomuraea endophytica]|uniref:FHA domain-containing protein n=1 Tax=Nonomuraea endophytica TaxID=714136 RepID=A0A7W8AEZ8_9ACTN|nr:FHA domain-containing protein [Nonomuraea endophytica]MBB5083856.1 hypothetical protein [Nonomuraea endophytica]
MFSIIVVPAGCAGPDGHIRLAQGERLVFGRAPAGAGAQLMIAHGGVSRVAGEVTATGTFWTLSNLSRRQTYVVENPEGAGEHIKIAPGRVEAPVPFEFSRVVLPAGEELVGFDVWAPRHDYRTVDDRELAGALTAPAFPLDRGTRYFLVLVALGESRLRGELHTPPPTVEQLVQRLRPIWPDVSRTSVQWNIDYLAVKLRLKPAPETAYRGSRVNSKKASLVSLALRFDLVNEDDLALLDGGAS